MSHGKFVTAINCMDGRTQEPVIRWAKKRFGVDFIDMINEPGPDLVLLTEDKNFLNYTLKKIQISTEKHGSNRLIIVGHHDCAGNPVSRDKHIELIKKSMEIARRYLSEIEIIGVYINENWEVEEL
ncbi:MAG: carbonic anhydrase [Myxococcota bacterium]